MKRNTLGRGLSEIETPIMRQLNLFGESPEPSFHNTIKSKGKELVASEASAKKQEEKIMDIFRQYPDKKMTPFQVFDIGVKQKLFHRYTPLTSIRRGMTNLTKKHNLLTKLSEKKIERLGEYNFFWELKK
jgi:hypothetical protein